MYNNEHILKLISERKIAKNTFNVVYKKAIDILKKDNNIKALNKNNAQTFITYKACSIYVASFAKALNFNEAQTKQLKSYVQNVYDNNNNFKCINIKEILNIYYNNYKKQITYHLLSDER